MRNIRKFNILYIFLIFVLIASSMLGVFVSVKTLEFNNKTTESKIADDLLPEIKDPAEGSGKDIIADGNKTTHTGYNLNQVKKVSDDGVYDIDDETYKNNTNYVISDYAGLKAFAGIVNSNDNNHTGWDGFKGKTIYLNADIDCGGNTVRIGMTYAGFARYLSGMTFDGQNHTISNFQLATAPILDATGLFYRLRDSTIQNLKLKDVKGPNTNDNQSIGVLLGDNLNGVKIKNCIVENFILQSPASTTDISGIVYASSGNLSISNCFVKNLAVGSGAERAVGPASRMTTNNDKKEDITIKIENCVVDSDGLDVFTDAETCNGVVYMFKQTIITVLVDNCISSEMTIEGLSCSTIGGNTSTEPTTWYYAQDYNDSFPYLRQFVEKWKYVHFSTDNGKSVSLSSILIPIDANQTYSDSGKNTIKVYDIDIVAYKPDSMCDHATANWRLTTLYTAAEAGTTIYEYICTFTVKTRTLTFPVTDNATTYVDGIKQTETKRFTLWCGSQLEYSCEKYSKRLIIKSVTYVFKDSNGVEHKVKYETEGVKYYIFNATTDDEEKRHKDLTINVKTQLKTYNIILK